MAILPLTLKSFHSGACIEKALVHTSDALPIQTPHQNRKVSPYHCTFVFLAHHFALTSNTRQEQQQAQSPVLYQDPGTPNPRVPPFLACLLFEWDLKNESHVNLNIRYLFFDQRASIWPAGNRPDQSHADFSCQVSFYLMVRLSEVMYLWQPRLKEAKPDVYSNKSNNQIQSGK